MSVPELLTQWQDAERQLGDPEAVETAASQLPDRYAWLLRIMEALDLGEPGPARLLADRAREAGHPDLGGLLEILTTPRDAGAEAADPILARVAAADGDAIAGIPVVDLLRCLATARTGRPGTPGEELAGCAGAGPLLRAATMLLTDDRHDVYTSPLTASISLRADQLQMAARAVQITGTTRREHIQAHYDGQLALTLPHARWPALAHDIEDGDLTQWAHTRTPWTGAHDQTIFSLMSAPEEARRAFLGGILRRIARDLPLGRFAGITRPVRAAFSLACRIPGLEGLAIQIAVLQLRTDRVDPTFDGNAVVLLTQLWAKRQTFPGPIQLMLAESLTEASGLGADPADLLDALTTRLAHLPSTAAGAVLLASALRTPPQQLVASLESAGCPPQRLRHLMGMHAAASGFHAQALRAVPRLLEEPADPAAASQLMELILSGLHTPEGLAEALVEPFIAALDALAHPEISPSLWAGLAGRPAIQAVFTDTHRDAAIRAARQPTEGSRERAAALLVLGLLGADAARDAVREVGRELRSRPAADAADLALEVLAWLHAWDPTLARTGEAGAKALTRFLMRSGGAPADAAAQRWQLTGQPLRGAVDWFLAQHRDGPPPPPWRFLIEQVLTPPQVVAHVYSAALAELDTAGCDSMTELVPALQLAVRARLMGDRK